MKTNLKTILLISLTALSFTACTSSHNNLVSVSDVHLYSSNYGLVEDHSADQRVQQELIAMNLPVEVEMPRHLPEGWTTNLEKDPDAFYAHEFVEKEEVITYKYKFDKKFYNNAEWRSADSN